MIARASILGVVVVLGVAFTYRHVRATQTTQATQKLGVICVQNIEQLEPWLAKGWQIKVNNEIGLCARRPE